MIVNRNNKRKHFMHEMVTDDIIGHRGSAEKSESTSMKENDDGSSASGRGGREEIELEIVCGSTVVSEVETELTSLGLGEM